MASICFSGNTVYVVGFKPDVTHKAVIDALVKAGLVQPTTKTKTDQENAMVFEITARNGNVSDIYRYVEMHNTRTIDNVKTLIRRKIIEDNGNTNLVEIGKSTKPKG